jgi:uncharacterized protein YyaL (SSP411 family)
MHAYTNEGSYRDKAEQTLEVFAGMAAQVGIFGGTYGLAVIHFVQPHTQVVVIGKSDAADALADAALQPFSVSKAVLQLPENEVTPRNLPPALGETIPNVPGLKSGKELAVVCTGFACLPPFADAKALSSALGQQSGK